MKKSKFESIIKERISDNAFKNLINIKYTHSKVKNIEHDTLKIQKYLQPNQTKIQREESELIFKLRCRVTEVKANLKSMYDNTDCGACGQEEESQEHVIKCEVLNKKEKIEFNYEKINSGTVKEKIEIAKKFEENFNLLKNNKL